MVHLPCEPYEYAESIEGQSRTVRHTFVDDDEVGELEPTAKGEVITGIGEVTQWCVRAKATMAKRNGLDKPTFVRVLGR